MTTCEGCDRRRGYHRILHWFERRIDVYLCKSCQRVAAMMTARMDLLMAPRPGADEHGNRLH